MHFRVQLIMSSSSFVKMSTQLLREIFHFQNQCVIVYAAKHADIYTTELFSVKKVSTKSSCQTTASQTDFLS